MPVPASVREFLPAPVPPVPQQVVALLTQNLSISIIAGSASQTPPRSSPSAGLQEMDRKAENSLLCIIQHNAQAVDGTTVNCLSILLVVGGWISPVFLQESFDRGCVSSHPGDRGHLVFKFSDHLQPARVFQMVADSIPLTAEAVTASGAAVISDANGGATAAASLSVLVENWRMITILSKRPGAETVVLTAALSIWTKENEKDY